MIYFLQPDRIARHLDRSSARYTAWTELDAWAIFIRAAVVP